MSDKLDLPQSNLDLNPILAQTAKTNRALTSGTKELQGVYNGAKSYTDANADLYKTIGDNTNIIETTKQNAELATQQARTQAANKLGTNYKDQGEVLSALADTISEQYKVRDAALAEIQKKQSTNFLEDPLGWVVNQFTINDDIKAHNVADERLANAQQQYQTLNTLTQSAITTQNALTESITASTIKAGADNISAQAAIKANDEKLKGVVYNAEAIKSAMQLSKDQLNNSFQVFNAQKQEQQVEIALAHLALSREEFSWRKEEKVKGQQDDAYLIDLINEGRKQRLGPQADLLTPGTARANTALSLLKSNSPVGQEFQVDYKIGEQSRATGVKVLAPSPAQAIEMISTMPVNLAPAQAPVKELLDQARENVAKTIVATGEKDKAVIAANLNAEVKRLVEEQSKKIVTGDSSNIFNIPSIQTLIKNDAVKDLPVVKAVIAPAVANGADLTDPNKVFALAATAMKEGKISYAQALELSTIYQSGVRVNMEAKQLSSLGIVPKWSYNSQIQTNPVSPFGGKQIVDLTKPDAVGRALNKYLSSAALAESIDYINPVNKGIDLAGAVRGDNIPPNSGFPNFVPTQK